MNSSNSFNICPRCGNSNALTAKYCSRCGTQLSVPEEPIICHACHTRNTAMANYCRNCGAQLKLGAETKICPKCGKEVEYDTQVCKCGYSFATLSETAPLRSSNASSVGGQGKSVRASRGIGSRKGGRGWAIAALIFILLIAYYVIVPFQIYNGEVAKVTLRISAVVGVDKGITNDVGGMSIYMHDTYNYGFDFLSDFTVRLRDCITGEAAIGQGAGFAQTLSYLFGGTAGEAWLTSLVLLFVAVATVHLIVCIVRIFTRKRSKRMNWFFLIVAIITTLIVGLLTLFNSVAVSGSLLNKIADCFILGSREKLGYAIWMIPIYFWFFFLFSLCAKTRKFKERAI